MSYSLGPKLRYLNTDFTLGNYLFGSVKLIRILAMAQNLILVQNFYLQIEAVGKMSLFLELISAHLCMLIIRWKDILILGEGLIKE